MLTTTILSRAVLGFVLITVWTSLYCASASEIHQDETEGAVATASVSSPGLLRSRTPRSPIVRRRRLNSYGGDSTDIIHWDSKDDDISTEKVLSYAYAYDDEQSYPIKSWSKDDRDDDEYISNDLNFTHPPPHHYDDDDDDSTPYTNGDYDDDDDCLKPCKAHKPYGKGSHDNYNGAGDDSGHYTHSKSGKAHSTYKSAHRGKGKGHHYTHSKSGKGTYKSTRSERVKDWESTIVNEIFGHLDADGFSFIYDSSDNGFGYGKKVKNIDSYGKSKSKGGKKMMHGGRWRENKSRSEKEDEVLDTTAKSIYW